MFRNIVFFASKKQITPIILLFFALSFNQTSFCAGEEEFLIPLAINQKPFTALKESADNLTATLGTSVKDLSQTLKDPKIKIDLPTAADVNLHVPPITLMQTGSAALFFYSGYCAFSELKKKREDMSRQTLIASAGCMIAFGSLFAYSKQINNWLFN